MAISMIGKKIQLTVNTAVKADFVGFTHLLRMELRGDWLTKKGTFITVGEESRRLTGVLVTTGLPRRRRTNEIF